MKYFTDNGLYQDYYYEQIVQKNNNLLLEFNKYYNDLIYNGLETILDKVSHMCDSCDGNGNCVSCNDTGEVVVNLIKKEFRSLLERLSREYDLAIFYTNDIFANYSNLEKLYDIFDAMIDTIIEESMYNKKVLVV